MQQSILKGLAGTVGIAITVKQIVLAIASIYCNAINPS
jgi:hypothetical protein